MTDPLPHPEITPPLPRLDLPRPAAVCPAFPPRLAVGTRVLQVNKFWGADRGGVEAVLDGYATGLASVGYSVQVLTCRPWRTPLRPAPPGVDVVELPAPVFASMPCRPAFLTHLHSAAARADLLHFHVPFPLAEAAALALPPGVPRVATVHALVTRHPAWLRSLYSHLLGRFFSQMNAIIVSSPEMAASPLLYPFAARLRVIPFGCRFENQPPLPPVAPSLLPPLGSRPVVLFAGRLVPYKGVNILLDAAVGLDADVWIVGDGPERRHLERQAARNHLHSQVTFLGHLPDDSLRAALLRASLLVLPSISASETFGLIQIEAMAAGLPVLNTLLSTGVNFVCPHGVAGWSVPPNDAPALRQALRYLLAHPDLLEALARRAVHRVRRLFAMQAQIRRLHQVYQDVLAL